MVRSRYRSFADFRPVLSAGGRIVSLAVRSNKLYDVMGRLTSVTVNANLSVSGNGSNNDTNLTTGYAYDSLGRKTDVTDPAGHVSHASYDNLGRVTSGITDYGTGHLNITAIAAYDALGEAIATCSPDAVVAGCNSSNITTSSLAWHYTYDLMGRVATATPPVNVGTALATTTANYETGGRLASTVESVGANTIRSTGYGYDAAGRQTSTAVTVGSSTLTTALTLDSLGRNTAVSTSGTSSDTLSAAYDPTGRLLSISRGGATLTSYAYNADGTASSRTDNGSATSTFAYTTLGQLRTAGLPGSTSASFTWALDGTMAGRTWGSSISGTYAYDGAKRPTGLSITRSGAGTSDTIARTYDVTGNVTSETQVLGGVTGAGKTVLAGSQTQSFSYDAAGRLTNSSFSGSITEARTYVYDADGNRTSVTEAGVTTYYAYDRTDSILWKGPNADGSGSSAFVYDSLGQLVSSYPSVPDASGTVPTSYSYDPAGHLSQITAGGHVSAFGIDALGRHASVQVDAGAITAYTYLGTSNTVSAQTTSGNTVYSGIDAIGDRITTTEGAASVYVIPDLHGNVTATADTSSGPVFLSAYRYDAYGETCAAYLAGSLSSDTNPWRFQGRILENTSGQTDLYDFGARSYDPSLGAFTSFDTVAGSAQNPLTLNRYLYALANPETLVDPDGHLACGGGLDPLSAARCEAINAPAVAAARQSVQCGGGLDPLSAAQCETHRAAVVSKARAKAGTGPTLKEIWESQAADRARAAAAAEPAKPQDKPRDCGWIGVCFDLGQAVSNVTGTAGQIWQNTGGKAVNAATHNMDPACLATIAIPGACAVVQLAKENPTAALLLGTAGLCALGVLLGPEACLPLAGVAIYTVGNTASNVLTGGCDVLANAFGCVTNGWRWQDAAITAAGTTVMGLLPESFAVETVGGVAVATAGALAVGGAVGFGSDVVSQELQHPGRIDWEHASCQGAVGAYSAAYVAGSLTGKQGLANLEKGVAWGIGTAVFGAGFCSQS